MRIPWRRPRPAVGSARAMDRTGDGWISREDGNGIVWVNWQQVLTTGDAWY